MKRFVFIPFNVFNCDESLKQAQKLSKDTKLPIRIGEEKDSISNCVEIVSFPEIKKVNFEEKVKKNYTHCIDITNEFVDMNDCLFYINFNDREEEVKPIIKEKHLIRIRRRYSDCGNYSFFLKKENKIICNGDFVVYDS